MNWPDNPTPPLSGDPLSLRRPGQSAGATFLMWTWHLLFQAVVYAIILLSMAALAYPIAVFVLWLRIRGQ